MCKNPQILPLSVLEIMEQCLQRRRFVYTSSNTKEETKKRRVEENSQENCIDDCPSELPPCREMNERCRQEKPYILLIQYDDVRMTSERWRQHQSRLTDSTTWTNIHACNMRIR
jgi:hypothetical protein